MDGIEDASKDGKVDKDETNPRNHDSDQDNIPDGVEDWDNRGVIDFGESSPISQDTDQDGIPDNVEDSNRNGRCDIEFTDQERPLLPDTLDSTGVVVFPGEWETSCAFLPDTDYDGLKDSAEDCNKSGTVDADEPDPRNPDSDGDTLIDGREDINANCVLDLNETSPMSSTTYGQNDLDYNERKRGIDVGCGCNVAGGSAPATQGLGMILFGLSLAVVRVRRKK